MLRHASVRARTVEDKARVFIRLFDEIAEAAFAVFVQDEYVVEFRRERGTGEGRRMRDRRRSQILCQRGGPCQGTQKFPPASEKAFLRHLYNFTQVDLSTI